MLCKNIIEMIESAYPRCYALSWDNVGLLAGSRQKEVKKIYVALDADDEVVEEAVSGTKTMEEMADEWNEKWTAAQESNGVEY